MGQAIARSSSRPHIKILQVPSKHVVPCKGKERLQLFSASAAATFRQVHVHSDLVFQGSSYGNRPCSVIHSRRPRQTSVSYLRLNLSNTSIGDLPFQELTLQGNKDFIISNRTYKHNHCYFSDSSLILL